MPNDVCPIDEFLRVVGGRWKAPILWNLLAGPRRFNDLRRQIPNVTQKVFTQQLRDLKRDGLVSRTVHGESPIRVEYELTDLGRTLRPVLVSIHEWASEHCLLAGRSEPGHPAPRGRRRRTGGKGPAIE